MIETILIARENKSGKTVVLAGLEIPYKDQLAKYKGFTAPTHEEFSSVGIFTLNPIKKPLRFITKVVSEARSKEHSDRLKSASTAAVIQPKKNQEKINSTTTTLKTKLP